MSGNSTRHPSKIDTATGEDVMQSHLTSQSQSATSQHDDTNSTPLPHLIEKKLMRKIDFRVIPVLCILYIMAFLDRVNIANARSFGLVDDLQLQGNQFNTALTIFFVPYILLEIPSNILLKRLHPNVWLSGCMFMFGIVTMCQGLVRTYSGLLVTRFFLGFFETGMFPGCFYLIGMWYKRSEAQRRYSFFFSSTSLAGAFGGLFASAIGKMDGLRDLRGWRWIFILEGLLTAIVSLIVFFLIPSFPEESVWLTTDEKVYIKDRLIVDQASSDVDERVSFKNIMRVIFDLKVILGGFMYLGMVVPAYGYAYFAPTIISTFNYSPIQTQLYSVTPWVCAFAFSMLIAFSSDYIKHRFLFTLCAIGVAAAGLAILLIVHDKTRLRYVGLILVAMGTFSAMPIIVCWFTMNLTSHLRRAVGTAWQISFGNIGGIIATYAFLKKDAPKYISGYSICLGFLLFSGLSCVVYAIVIFQENRKNCDIRYSHSIKKDMESTSKNLLSNHKLLL